MLAVATPLFVAAQTGMQFEDFQAKAKTCTLPCEAAAAVDDAWAASWSLSTLPEALQTNLAIIGWTDEAWLGCFECECVAKRRITLPRY